MGYPRYVFAGRSGFLSRDTPSGRLRGSEYERVEADMMSKVFKDRVTGRDAFAQFRRYTEGADRKLNSAQSMLRYQSPAERKIQALRQELSEAFALVEKELGE